MTDEKEMKPAFARSLSNAGLDGEILADKILWAKEGLDRILAKFDGSENHKQIRRLRKRILKKLLKEAADLTLNAKLTSPPISAGATEK